MTRILRDPRQGEGGDLREMHTNMKTAKKYPPPRTSLAALRRAIPRTCAMDRVEHRSGANMFVVSAGRGPTCFVETGGGGGWGWWR